jgi:hypothetical protein
MKKKKKIASCTGIFTWDGIERRSDRYGAVNISATDFDSTARVERKFDIDGLRQLVGKRVSIKARVLAVRDSGHLGDLFRGIFPSRPDVGEVIDLGQGTLALEACSWDEFPAIALKPPDGRQHDWYAPHKLYRLHDQTVELMVSEV